MPGKMAGVDLFRDRLVIGEDHARAGAQASFVRGRGGDMGVAGRRLG